MINILLAEDHVILRHGIISLLQKDPDLNVVGEAGNGLEVIEIMKAKSVDLLIADITMPFIDGIEATKFVTDNYETKVMILSMQQELRYVYNSFEAGAIGYMLKTSGSEELVFAIKKVASGHPYISHKISLELINKIMVGKPTPIIDNLDRHLTTNESEILNLIAEGFTNTEIADKVFRSKRTVETHRKNIMEKTNTRNTAALIKFAVINGILK